MRRRRRAKPKNQGKKVEGQFQEQLEAHFKKKIFCHRNYDTADATGRAGKLTLVAAQPSDFIVTLNGTTAYVEVKDCNSKTSFPFSNIRESQWNAAKQQVAAKGLYFFVVHHQGTWYCIPAKVILDTTTRKSLPWKDIKQYELKALVDIKRYFK